MLAIVAVALAFHLWGLRRDFPYITGEDQTLIVNPAYRIASSGDLNPRRFVHPASTMIYPLALVYHLWNAATHSGSWLHVDRNLPRTFYAHPLGFYIAGRLLADVYALLAIGALYAVGRRAFAHETALVGTLLATFYPSDIFNKQVRTESAALFFALLALWGCLRLLEAPSKRRQLVAGGIIGLAIATKYYLAPLLAVLALADAVSVWKGRAQLRWTDAVLEVATGLGAVAFGFALSTPYFLLDRATVTHDLQLIGVTGPELAARGLRPLRNLAWYLGGALPRTISPPQVVAAAMGIVLVIQRRDPKQYLLLMFAVAFLAPLSLHPWLFDRWLIPALPVFALFAAHALQTTLSYLTMRLHWTRIGHRTAMVLGTAGLMAMPSVQLVQMHRHYANPSTYALARQWVEEHLPRGTHLVYEWETLPAPLEATRLGVGNWLNHDNGCEFIELSMSKLSVRNSLEYYVRGGYRHLVTSSLMYAVYPADAEHYPAEAAFYTDLLARGRLLHQVDASPEREGGEIRIYEIP